MHTVETTSWHIVSLALAVGLLTACATDSTPTASGCDDGARRCQGTLLEQCADGAWATVLDCEVSDLTCGSVASDVQCVAEAGNNIGGNNGDNANPNNSSSNNATNNDPDNGSNNGTNNSTNNSTNNASNNATNNDPNNADPNNSTPITLTCESVPACGGDPTGSWTSAVNCDPLSYEELFPNFCDDIVIESDNREFEATLDMNSRGTYSLTSRHNIEITLRIPPSCLDDLNCNNAEQAFNISNENKEQAALCGPTSPPGGCHCQVLTQSNFTYTGDWAVLEEGESPLTISESGGSADWDFCVTGDQFATQPSDLPGSRPFLYTRVEE